MKYDFVKLICDIVSILAVAGWLLKFVSKPTKRLINKITEVKRKRYYNVIDSEDFVKWRDMVLKYLYGEKYFTHEVGYDFPVYALECAKPLPYPFNEFYSENDIPFHLYKKNNNDELIESSLDNQVCVYPDKRTIKKFRKLLIKIRYPGLLGFTLDRYDMSDGKITHVYPRLGKYSQTVDSSLILEYEMYKAYKKTKGKVALSKNIWELFPLRANIHKNHTIEEVLFSGLNRYSLLSVQGFIIFFDPEVGQGEYVTLIAQRSENVTSKIGYYQFLPAGGFELFEREGNCKTDIIKDNYSFGKAFFREYLEEVFNKTKFGQVPEDGQESLHMIMKNRDIRTITNLIKKGKAHFELLGSAVDLVNLRHDMSFILRIDDDDFYNNIFELNEEFVSAKIKQRMPLRKLDEKLEGEYKICQASVGLYNMVKKNHLYRELKDNDFKKLPNNE